MMRKNLFSKELKKLKKSPQNDLAFIYQPNYDIYFKVTSSLPFKSLFYSAPRRRQENQEEVFHTCQLFRT